MSMPQDLRHIDYYDYYSSKIEAASRYIKQYARKGHGRRNFKGQTFRSYRNGPRPRGMQDYQNLQWDPSIYRGRTFRDFREKNLPPNETIVNFNKYCCLSCNTTTRPLLATNRRKLELGLPRQKVGGVFRPTTDEIMFEESSGRKRHKQDESRKEMEPFLLEQKEQPEYVESGAQGDEIKDRPKRNCQSVAIGRSSSTQADICIIGTGSQEDPLEPILEHMGSKVLEQSLLETFEEFELHAIRCAIRSYMDRRRNREARQVKLVEDQLFKETQMEMERVRRDNELQMELEADERVAAILFSINSCNHVISNTLDSLRKNKFLAAETHDAEIFQPWVHQQMYRHLQVPRMIVNDIIQNVENERLAELNLSTLLNASPTTAQDEEEEEILDDLPKLTSAIEDEDYNSSVGPPPNTASSLPYTTTDDEGDSTAEEKSVRIDTKPKPK